MTDLDHFAAIVAAQIRSMGMAAENASAVQPVHFGLAAFDELAKSIEGRLSIESEAVERLDQIREILDAVFERNKRTGSPMTGAELKTIWQLAGGGDE